MKNVICTMFLVVALAVLALPTFAQRGPGDGGGMNGGGMKNPGTMYFLMSDSCRLVLESKMSAEDAAAFEAAVTDYRNIDKQLQDLRAQMEAAMRAGDKATLDQLMQQAQQLQQQQGTDLNTMNTLLGKYQADADATMRDCRPTMGGKTGDPSDSSHRGGRGRGPGNGKPNPRLNNDGGFFIGHDTCRWALEAHMTADDAAAFEAAALALQADVQTGRDLMKQLRDAMKARDTAAAAAIRQQLSDLRAKAKADHAAYVQLLAKYADQIGAVRKECWTPRRPDGGRIGDDGTKGGDAGQILRVAPIFPNPVKSGDPVTLNYTLASDAQVSITLNDAMGAQLQQLTNESEVAGNYTVTIPTEGLQAGSYYLRIQAGADVKTEKLAIVQ